LKGYGAVFGNVDLQGDIIAPGAFKGSLGSFISSGYLCADHNWEKRIGTIETAHEDKHGLYFESRFHGTALAQECRQIIKERLERGKSVALSIGFKVLDDIELGNGIRELKALQLYEISVVGVAANALAMATGLKSSDAGRLERIAEYQELTSDLWNRWAANALHEMQLRHYRNKVAELER